jgi:hypothetical protein
MAVSPAWPAEPVGVAQPATLRRRARTPPALGDEEGRGWVRKRGDFGVSLSIRFPAPALSGSRFLAISSRAVGVSSVKKSGAVAGIVATSREGQRKPRSGPAAQHRRSGPERERRRPIFCCF